ESFRLSLHDALPIFEDARDAVEDRGGDRLARVGLVRDGAAEHDVVGEQAVDPHHRTGGDAALDEISEGLHGWFPFDWDDGWVIGKFAAWLLIAAGVFNVAI